MGSPNDEMRPEERPLLEDGSSQNEVDGLYTRDGSVDIKGQPALKAKTENWRACSFILGTECCERLAFYGIRVNLVSYLTKKLHQSNVSAARNISTWAGTCCLTPLIGASLADACWGRYWTIAVFSTIYLIGMCILAVSALVPALKPAECVDSLCPSATPAQYLVFFFGLYLVALGTGGIKPCVSSLGADQFDDTDSKERVKKASFFNWFYFSINIGGLVAGTVMVWIQDNAGWGLGFTIPAICMAIAIISFLLAPLYRFQKPGGSPLTRVCQVVVASVLKWNLKLPTDGTPLYENPERIPAISGSRKLERTDQLKFLDKAAIILDNENSDEHSVDPWRLCTVTQVEELKTLVRMFPIWATAVIFSTVYSQMTMFIEQGITMDATLGSFSIPPAALVSFDTISVLLWVPVYDRFLIPLVRKFTGNEKGFTHLQRMGIGLFISITSMSVAAFLEMKRLALVNSLGLIDKDVPVPLSILWQAPQYILMGAAEVFTFIGQLEFFYEKSPETMRSLCSALALLAMSLGSYLSSFLLTVVTAMTTRGGKGGWKPDNLNEGRLDYFFWFLAGLSSLNAVVYVFCAKMYVQKQAS